MDYIDGWKDVLLAIEDLVYAERMDFDSAVSCCYEHLRVLLRWREAGMQGDPPELERERLSVVSVLDDLSPEGTR